MFFFRFIYGIILPIDELIFFQDGYCTTNQIAIWKVYRQNGSKPASDVAWICCDPCDPSPNVVNHDEPQGSLIYMVDYPMNTQFLTAILSTINLYQPLLPIRNHY